MAFNSNKDLTQTELAFFGGSFTAINREYMMSLLEIGSRLVDEFSMKGIRISTRPDFIDNEILAILKAYKVTSIELGAQSMCDEVLLKNNRGHNSDSIVKASNLIKSAGFELGLQMMTGLFGSNYDRDFETAKLLINLKPKTLRVYPTVVFEDTQLCQLYRSGEYKQADFDETVDLCSCIIELCEKENVKIIRLGLHSSEQVLNAVAGIKHPAFMQVCKSRIFLKKMLKYLKGKPSGYYEFCVENKLLSDAVGQNRENINKLNDLGYMVKIFSENSKRSKNAFKIN